MPRVPSIEGPTVEARPLQPVYDSGRGADRDAFGGAIGRGLEGFGRGVGGVGDALTSISLQRRETRAAEADVEFTAGARKINHGDAQEGTTGFFALRGRDALDNAKATADALTKLKDDIVAKYGEDPAVSRHVSNMLGKRLQGHLQDISEYSTAQERSHRNTVFEARLGEAAQDFALSPRAHAQSVAIIQDTVNALAASEGWSPEVQQHKLEQSLTAMYAGGIEAAINRGDVETANAIFSEHKTKIDGPVAAEIEKTLNAANVTHEAQRIHDAIMEVAANEQEALKLVREQATGEVRDDAERRIHNTFAWKAQDEARQDREARQEATKLMEQGVSYDEALAQIGPEKANRIRSNTSDVNGLRALEKSVAEGNIYARASDGTTLTKWMTMPYAEMMERGEEGILLDRNKMKEAEYKAVLDRYRTFLNAKNNAPEQKNRIASQADTIMHRYFNSDKRFAWGSKEQTKVQLQRETALRNEVYEWAWAYYDQNGKLPDEQLLHKRVSQAAVDFDRNPYGFTGDFVVNPGAGLTKEQRDALKDELTPEQKQVLRLDPAHVPSGVMERVNGILQRVGLQPTQERVERIAGQLFLADEFGDSDAGRRIQEFVMEEGGRLAPASQTSSTGAVGASRGIPVEGSSPLDAGIIEGDRTVDNDYLTKVAMVESNNDPEILAGQRRVDGKLVGEPVGTAAGLYQFTEKTWLDIVRKYEPEFMRGVNREDVLDLRFDPAVARRMMGHLTAENRRMLEAARVPVTDGTLYLAHFAGAPTAVKLMKARPETPTEEIFSKTAMKNNPHLRGKSAGWVVDWANRKMKV